MCDFMIETNFNPFRTKCMNFVDLVWIICGSKKNDRRRAARVSGTRSIGIRRHGTNIEQIIEWIDWIYFCN